MAPPKKQGKLSRSAQYYRDHPEAREKKKETDTKINRRPEQRKKRAELSQKNREYDKKHGKGSRAGKDYDHATNSYVSSSTNRGRKNGTKGDKKARG
jgi:hypothetical protein|nr:MAG TPA: hypothetical protein [Crassvirales sp.]